MIGLFYGTIVCEFVEGEAHYGNFARARVCKRKTFYDEDRRVNQIRIIKNFSRVS